VLVFDSPKTDREIQWNSTQFLVDKKGNIISRFEPAVTPGAAELAETVEAASRQLGRCLTLASIFPGLNPSELRL
jgi:glutathione peroxidase-family protein